jgi:hypothetical protein
MGPTTGAHPFSSSTNVDAVNAAKNWKSSDYRSQDLDGNSEAGSEGVIQCYSRR